MSRHDSRQIETVKVMLHKGDTGSSIDSIEKTGTNVLVDTYTITLTDGSKHTFTVTNGRGIEDVSKTSQGLVDTYTITFNDNTYYEFTVSNAKSIDSIEKTDTQGLVDTYTITFNNGQTQNFSVTNGRAIEDIQVTSSQGLVDIYTIYFNDGTTLEIPFTKTNVDMDTELSTTSLNPVENRVITNALNGKSDTGHTHDDKYYTESEIDTKVSTLNTAINGKAPTNHASTATTYGVGSTTNYGHVKVDSSVSVSSTNPVQNKAIVNFCTTNFPVSRVESFGTVRQFLNILNNGAISDTLLAHCEKLNGSGINKIWGTSTWSDKRIKTNIKDSDVNALDIISRLEPKEFDYIDKKYGSHTTLGFIAQNVEEYIPRAILECPQSTNGNDLKIKTLAYERVVPYLIKAIQELQAEVNQLKEDKQ